MEEIWGLSRNGSHRELLPNTTISNCMQEFGLSVIYNGIYLYPKAVLACICFTASVFRTNIQTEILGKNLRLLLR